jgi:hypothetical protein
MQIRHQGLVNLQIKVGQDRRLGVGRGEVTLSKLVGCKCMGDIK